MIWNCQWDLSLNALGWNMPISDAGVISTGKYPVRTKPWLPRRPRISNNSSVQSGSTRGTWKLVPSKNKGRMFFQPCENSSCRNVTSSCELARVLFILYSGRMSSTMVSRFTDACIIVLSLNGSHSFALASFSLAESVNVQEANARLKEKVL